VVSDVSLGYGTPQVQLFAQSLAEHYGQEIVVFEPDQSGRAPLTPWDPRCSIQRVPTDDSPYSETGRIEYILNVADRLNRQRPATVVIFCSFCLPVLAKLRYRPRNTIYVLIEMVAPYGDFDLQMNRHLADRIDLVVFPEENRARLDIAECGFGGKPVAILYNVSNRGLHPFVPVQDRLPRLYYGGTISRDLGMAEYFMGSDLSDVAFDLYGDITGPNHQALADAFNSGRTQLSYRGCVDARRLAALRRRYAFSLVMYRPSQTHTHFAAPNKFFEAIADGVPPIATPHPQCKMLIDRYRCGIVIEDWSYEAFARAVKRAVKMIGTPEHSELIDNCRRAVEEELNWPRQFDNVRRLLPAA
jgi:glycosyltransferase involved in cell wall biosynthesis